MTKQKKVSKIGTKQTLRKLANTANFAKLEEWGAT
jgi:hypothetical protein